MWQVLVGSAIRPFRDLGGLGGRRSLGGGGGGGSGGGGELAGAAKEVGAVEIDVEGEPIDVAIWIFVLVDNATVVVAVMPERLGDFGMYYRYTHP